MRQGGHMLQQENKAINEKLSWGVPQSEPNQQKDINLHTAAVYVALRNF